MKLLNFRFHIVMLDLQVILTFLGLLTSGESQDVRVPTVSGKHEKNNFVNFMFHSLCALYEMVIQYLPLR